MLPKSSRASLEIREAILFLNVFGVAKSVAIRTQWFAVEVGSLSLFAPTLNISKIAYKTSPFLQCYIEQLMDSRLKCQVGLCQIFPSFPLASILPNCGLEIHWYLCLPWKARKWTDNQFRSTASKSVGTAKDDTKEPTKKVGFFVVLFRFSLRIWHGFSLRTAGRINDCFSSNPRPEPICRTLATQLQNDTCRVCTCAGFLCILIESAGAGMWIIEVIFPVQHIKQKSSWK